MAGRAEAEALCRALNRVAPAPFVCEGHSGSSFSLSLAYRVVASYGEYISLERFFKVGAGGSVLQYRYPCGCARWFRSVFSSWEELVWMLEVELDGMIL